MHAHSSINNQTSSVYLPWVYDALLDPVFGQSVGNMIASSLASDPEPKTGVEAMFDAVNSKENMYRNYKEAAATVDWQQDDIVYVDDNGLNLDAGLSSTFNLTYEQAMQAGNLSTVVTRDAWASGGFWNDVGNIWSGYWDNENIAFSDALSMTWDSFTYSGRNLDRDYQVSTRAGGVAEAAGGLVGMIASGTASTTGFGAPIAAVSAVYSFDHFLAGIDTAIYGESRPTYLKQAAVDLGVNPLVYDAIDFGAGFMIGRPLYPSQFGDDLFRTNHYQWVDSTYYSGNVYDPNFVGPVQWKYVYRGDSSLRSEFLSSRSQLNNTNNSFLNANADSALLAEIRSTHGISSSDSPFIGVSQDRSVAEFFARGPNQRQNGFVSEFRIEQREFDYIATRNYENPQAWFEINPFIGKPEQEFLFNNLIDSKYLYRQYQVKPK